MTRCNVPLPAEQAAALHPPLVPPFSSGSAAALKRTYSSDTSAPSAKGRGLAPACTASSAAAPCALWPLAAGPPDILSLGPPEGAASWMAACTCTHQKQQGQHASTGASGHVAWVHGVTTLDCHTM